MKPLVTIGIPTYNRPQFLRESLASALAQTYPWIEVVVSDNGSDDASERVVQQMDGGRVRYHRNPNNIGALGNFFKVVELARGEYFAWLQDDDLIFRDFAARAVSSLTAEPSANCYLAYTYYSSTPNVLVSPGLFGPPISLDWVSGCGCLVPGALLTPLSLFVSVGIPPTQVFRTAVLRNHLHELADKRFPLFTERTLLAAVTREACFYADAYVGGIYRQHPDQYSSIEIFINNQYNSQWVAFARALNDTAGHNYKVTDEFITLLTKLSDQALGEWAATATGWPPDIRLCARVATAVRDAAAARGLPVNPPRGPVRRLASFLSTDLAPPIAVRAFRRLASRGR